MSENSYDITRKIVYNPVESGDKPVSRYTNIDNPDYIELVCNKNFEHDSEYYQELASPPPPPPSVNIEGDNRGNIVVVNGRRGCRPKDDDPPELKQYKEDYYRVNGEYPPDDDEILSAYNEARLEKSKSELEGKTKLAKTSKDYQDVLNSHPVAQNTFNNALKSTDAIFRMADGEIPILGTLDKKSIEKHASLIITGDMTQLLNSGKFESKEEKVALYNFMINAAEEEKKQLKDKNMDAKQKQLNEYLYDTQIKTYKDMLKQSGLVPEKIPGWKKFMAVVPDIISAFVIANPKNAGSLVRIGEISAKVNKIMQNKAGGSEFTLPSSTMEAIEENKQRVQKQKEDAKAREQEQADKDSLQTENSTSEEVKKEDTEPETLEAEA